MRLGPIIPGGSAGEPDEVYRDEDETPVTDSELVASFVLAGEPEDHAKAIVAKYGHLV